jgi:hypothetical protein
MFERVGSGHEVRWPRAAATPPTVFVGDHIDKLSNVAAMAHDDAGEAQSREDKIYGEPILNRVLVPAAEAVPARQATARPAAQSASLVDLEAQPRAPAARCYHRFSRHETAW